MLAYSRHEDMSIFVLDLRGEFSKDCVGQQGHTKFDLKMKESLIKAGKEVIVHGVKDLVLDRWDLFREILFESDFFKQLTISHPGSKEKASDSIIEKCRSNKSITLVNLFTRDSFDFIWRHLKDTSVQTFIFNTKEPKERLNNRLMWFDSNPEQFNKIYENIWRRICLLFTNDQSSGRDRAVKIEGILSMAFGDSGSNKPVVVIDLSKEDRGERVLWNDKIQAMVIKRLLDGINLSAEHRYAENKLLNTLVIIDEAHRLAPREKNDDETINSVRKTLVDAVRTTRKYGLGWMFISQTLSSLDRGIIDMLRVMFFGFGLAMGAEYLALRDLVGGDKNSLKLYQSFRDPQSTFDMENMQYSFMTIGPVSPLSFSGTPLFFNAYNSPEEFLSINKM
jgi:hypothetical protein